MAVQRRSSTQRRDGALRPVESISIPAYRSDPALRQLIEDPEGLDGILDFLKGLPEKLGKINPKTIEKGVDLLGKFKGKKGRNRPVPPGPQPISPPIESGGFLGINPLWFLVGGVGILGVILLLRRR